MGQNYPEIRQAGEALLEVCDGAISDDGQGYNGFDAPFAQDVLAKDFWTPRQAAAMHKVLRKYRKQLQGHGIDYDSIPVPVQEAPNRPNRPTTLDEGFFGSDPDYVAPRHGQVLQQVHQPTAPQVTHTVHDQYGLQFRVKFDYDPEVKDAFRAACKTTIWEPDTKTWIVPGKHASELLAFAKAQGWRWNDDALFEAMSRERSLRSVAQERQKAVAASSAEDSEFLSDWESRNGYKLFPYQRAGADYLVKKERAYLADEMGLGKTVQALAAIHATKGTPALVICPASAVTVWRRHVQEWLPGCTVSVAPEAPRAGSRHIHITSYDRATRNHAKLIQLGWKTVVCDEAHALKNRTAKRTQRICGHSDRRTGEEIPGLMHKAQYRYLLTGTPVPNRPVELIQPLMGLDRLRDVGGFVGFATRYCGWEKGIPGSIQGSVPENLPELNERLRAACWVRRLVADVKKDLPPKFTDHVPLALSNRSRYNAALRDIQAFLKKDPGIAEALVQLTTLRRIAAEEKVEATIDWVENVIDSGEKLVLMGWHNAPLEQIKAHFGQKAVILTGSTSAKAREQAVDRFQNDEDCRLFVGNLQAAGEAITLTAASNIAVFELPWNPGRLDQAIARIHRIGQTADQVMVHFLLAEDTIDEDIAELIDSKRKTIKAIEDGQAVKDEEMVSLLMKRLRRS